jgi:hypothetical protein
MRIDLPYSPSNHATAADARVVSRMYWYHAGHSTWRGFSITPFVAVVASRYWCGVLARRFNYCGSCWRRGDRAALEGFRRLGALLTSGRQSCRLFAPIVPALGATNLNRPTALVASESQDGSQQGRSVSWQNGSLPNRQIWYRTEEHGQQQHRPLQLRLMRIDGSGRSREM